MKRSMQKWSCEPLDFLPRVRNHPVPPHDTIWINFFFSYTFPLKNIHSLYLFMTGFIHKCELLDICSCEFGQADRRRNIPKYGCSESHILPTACLHLMWGCAGTSFVVKQKSNKEIQRSGWKMNVKLFKSLLKKSYAVHKNKNIAFWKTYIASKFDKIEMHVFQNAKLSFLWTAYR